MLQWSSSISAGGMFRDENPAPMLPALGELLLASSTWVPWTELPLFSSVYTFLESFGFVLQSSIQNNNLVSKTLPCYKPEHGRWDFSSRGIFWI